jgi:hypothetical protein
VPEQLRAAGPQQRERKLIKKDGTVLPVFTSIRPMPDGRFHYILRDATERKRAEETLRESETLYRRAIEAAGAVPYYLDYATETYRFIGDGIFTLTGFAPEEMTLARWRSLVQDYQLLGSRAVFHARSDSADARVIFPPESDELIRAEMANCAGCWIPSAGQTNTANRVVPSAFCKTLPGVNAPKTCGGCCMKWPRPCIPRPI